jgi:hypothetical protein
LSGPTEEEVLRRGWNLKFARVLLIDSNGDFGLVLVDGNAEGAELDLEYWYRNEHGTWHGGVSSGYGSLEDLRPSTVWDSGPCVNAAVYAIGKVQPNQVVQISFRGSRTIKRGNKFGLWAFVQCVESGTDPGKLPIIEIVPAEA